jgi:hypothetical protein
VSLRWRLERLSRYSIHAKFAVHRISSTNEVARLSIHSRSEIANYIGAGVTATVRSEETLSIGFEAP